MVNEEILSMGTHKRSPRVEALENKALLSGAGMRAAPPAAALVLPPTTGQPHALTGQVEGRWKIEPGNPDVGMTLSLEGSGTVSPLGSVHSTGTLHGTGFVKSGHSIGMLTLHNALGSVTIKLTGTPPQAGFSGFAMHYSFKILGGTGQYQGAHGQGKATLQELVIDPPGPQPVGSPPILVGPVFILHLTTAVPGM
jgi:hypothetical protein